MEGVERGSVKRKEAKAEMKEKKKARLIEEAIAMQDAKQQAAEAKKEAEPAKPAAVRGGPRMSKTASN